MQENKITLVINNTYEYKEWQNIKIEKSLENISGSFEVSYTQGFDRKTPAFGLVIPIKKGDEVKVLIDGQQIINGYIDSVNISYDSSSHKITATGRDKTADLIDSSLLGNVNLNNPFTIKRLFTKVLQSLNLQNDIKVINEFGYLSYDEDFDAGRGKGAWQIIDRYLQKKSVFATTNTNGDIVIFRGEFGNTNDSLIHLINGGNVNNIKSASFTDDASKRYNIISVISQSKATILFDLSENQGGESFLAEDETIRNTRKLEILSKTSLTSAECQDLAEFQKNIRYARGTFYNYTVQGFKQSNGELWLPNYLVHVRDEYFDIDESFLIKSVNFSQSLDSGSITELALVDKNSYTLREPVALSKEKGGLFAT